jgi:hypothetical protein
MQFSNLKSIKHNIKGTKTLDYKERSLLADMLKKARNKREDRKIEEDDHVDELATIAEH